jgi:hypothetical protein
MRSIFISGRNSRTFSPLIVGLLILAGTIVSSRAVAGRLKHSRVEILSPIPSAR